MVGRLGIADVGPVVGALATGEFPARAVVGEPVPITATVFREGHDAVGANVVIRAPGGAKSATIRMAPGAPGTDRWQALAVFDRPGLWSFAIEAFSDPFTTWQHTITVKIADGQGPGELANDLESGARLFARLAKSLPKAMQAARDSAAAASAALRDGELDVDRRVAPALDPAMSALVQAHPIRELVTRSPNFDVLVDRTRALFGSWYEFFPRSIGAVLDDEIETPTRPLRHGTLKDATKHLDYVASMGFDVVYLPPVHPIGAVNRKGPNNTLDAAAWDVGSPWAIGSKDGGHDAIHPELGTMADFTALVRRAKALGMEVALDLAFQTAPDHPWVSTHPEWFTTKPDGTIAYAENPPKKYQDIYPLNFDNDPKGIYAECLRVVLLWVEAGVKIFRVDNPHTKPINFWHKLITTVKKQHPDVLFLAEAFTRPAMMHALARIGFTQSYTYFTWRNTKPELEVYANDLVASADYMRPNFFVNTPDILTEYLQSGGPAAFVIRAVLAATMSPSWGVYSGYELFESTAVRAGSEEYLDTEKFQLRPRDFAAAIATGRSLAPLLTQLNAIRKAHPALHSLRNLHLQWIDNDSIVSFSKRDPLTGDTVLVLCNVDPRAAQAGWTSLDMPALGLQWGDRVTVRDLLSGAEYDWGQFNFVRLDPAYPAHVLLGERGPGVSTAHDPQWFKRAVFYEVLVRGFADSNGDGTGDLRGLIDKLDYLSWLGVDCLWIPPFYPSPLRDGGYDVSDYTGVLPEFGTVDDFTALLNAAHQRGIRVIVDFVANHTSDQHPWFQASRADPTGPYGDYYVWSDDNTRFSDARIIFVDTEPSNWTFDPIRKQYYWHRFFSHQPDLNFDSPDVQRAIIDALRFWLDKGIDGFRLDAVPYLFVRNGTNGENLPETHEFLKRLRKEIDRDYPDRILLCEANQWPADVVEYFGDPVIGDECQMAFHFPVMPRIFMAVRRESRYPISEIMAQTPSIPDNCQWGIFLRNHDELTLEMVSDEERDYMWAEYAKDPRMKANIGIRRRLAPLLENDLNQIELFTALLLSLPGSPVLYYGDEIGMGDNIWLGDRDGVRTPMQWTPDRNAGFSTTDPARLYLPVIMDSIYGYQVTNVEAQTRNSSSLLNWTRRMIAVRKANPAFGLGTFNDIGGSNPSVLSFVRDFGDDTVLCVNNLSRFPQAVELDLRPWEGSRPVELMGGAQFPAVGELPYLLTLAGHSFYWLRLPKLSREADREAAGDAPPSGFELSS